MTVQTICLDSRSWLVWTIFHIYLKFLLFSFNRDKRLDHKIVLEV